VDGGAIPLIRFAIDSGQGHLVDTVLGEEALGDAGSFDYT
jgi:hypothetical protein